MKFSKQQEENIISKAWNDVHEYNLGSWRFGTSLASVIHNSLDNKDEHQVELELIRRESDCNVALSKFNMYFVEEN